MAQILIVEDEPAVAEPLADFLSLQGYDTLTARDGGEGLELVLRHRPDLVLLDIMLPVTSGLDLCREIRKRGLRMPIVMLTAKGQEADKVAGLDAGADDYVTKPFGLRELHARIRAQLRRAQSRTPQASQYSFGDVVVHFKTREVVKAGRDRELAALEFELLSYFIEHRNEPLTRSELLTDVWGHKFAPTTRTVDTHVLNLRRKLEDNPREPLFILTVHGVGYKFVG